MRMRARRFMLLALAGALSCIATFGVLRLTRVGILGGSLVRLGALHHSFGLVSRGDEVTHVFRVRNFGPRTLSVKAVATSCTCLRADGPKSIPPGTTGEFVVTFASQTISAPKRVAQSVAVGIGGHRIIKFHVAGMVEEPIAVVPARVALPEQGERVLQIRRVALPPERFRNLQVTTASSLVELSPSSGDGDTRRFAVRRAQRAAQNAVAEKAEIKVTSGEDPNRTLASVPVELPTTAAVELVPSNVVVLVPNTAAGAEWQAKTRREVDLRIRDGKPWSVSRVELDDEGEAPSPLCVDLGRNATRIQLWLESPWPGEDNFWRRTLSVSLSDGAGQTRELPLHVVYLRSNPE